MRKHDSSLRPRKLVKELKRFKSNQIVIGSSRLAKKGHDEAEKPQLLLLLRLYVPGKHIQRLDGPSKRTLSENLPLLVNSAYPELNLELHLFLSTIVTNFVTSWYTKLGTDNNEFVDEVYGLLCIIVKELCQRWSRAVEGENLLRLVDDFAAILDGHVRETHLVDGELGFVREAKNQENATNRVLKTQDDKDVVARYLAQRHAIFDPETSAQNGNETPRNLYFKVLTRKMLEAVFLHRPENPLTSEIVDNFVVSLLGDFILEKAFLKLSSPSFIRGTLLAKLVEITAVPLKPQTNASLPTKVRNAYLTVRDFMRSAATTKAKILLTTENDGSWSILRSPIFSLLNTLTGFQNRLPVVYYLGQIAQCTVLSMGALAGKIDTFLGSYLLSNIWGASFLGDDSVAANLKNLRTVLFGDDSEKKEDPIILTRELAERISTSLMSLISNFGLSPSFFAYKGETAEDMRSHIANILESFESQDLIDDVLGSSRLNQLLLIQILDLLVARLFPELLQS